MLNTACASDMFCPLVCVLFYVLQTLTLFSIGLGRLASVNVLIVLIIPYQLQ